MHKDWLKNCRSWRLERLVFTTRWKLYKKQLVRRERTAIFRTVLMVRWKRNGGQKITTDCLNYNYLFLLFFFFISLKTYSPFLRLFVCIPFVLLFYSRLTTLILCQVMLSLCTCTKFLIKLGVLCRFSSFAATGGGWTVCLNESWSCFGLSKL